MKDKVWQQWFFDVLANNNITLLVTGELNFVDAELRKSTHELIAIAVNASDLDDAMIKLMDDCEGKVIFT